MPFRVLCLFFFSFTFLGCAENRVEEFELFVQDLKSVPKDKLTQSVKAIYSPTSIRAAKFLHKTPSTPEKDVLDEYVGFFIARYLDNQQVIQFKDEVFLYEKGVYKWQRQAEYKGYEGGFSELTAEFVYRDGRFEVAPHFTHPTAEQLVKLEDMQNVYAIYYVLDNVASYELYTNGKKLDMLNPDVSTAQLLDAVQGNNEIIFTFEKEDKSQPVTFASSVVFVAREQERKELLPDNLIHLYGKAMAKDKWGDLALSRDSMQTVQDNKLVLSVELK